MSITLSGYTFPGSTTHQVPSEEEWENNPIYTNFYGVAGSVEIRDAEHGRMVMIEARFGGYSTPALLQAALYVVDGKAGSLNDSTLTVVLGASSCTYRNCTFVKFNRSSKMQYDGSGVNGWYIDGVLVFRQLKRTP